MNKIKTPEQMERHLKGVANHRRIEIILLIAKNNTITLDQIINTTGANPKTIGEHTRRLYIAGLINKEYQDKFVVLSLSPYGKIFVKFLKFFQRLKI